MGKNSDVHYTPYIVAFFALIAFVMSVTLAATAYSVLESPGFNRVNDMVTINTGGPGATTQSESAGSPRNVMKMLIMFGAVGVLASVAGCAGALLSSQVLLIIFFCAMAFFATILLVDGSSTIEFEDMIEPVLQRQAEEFCNATLYPKYRTHVTNEDSTIGCPSPFTNMVAGTLNTNSDACSVECQARVSLINRMGGCPLLRRMCENHHFEDLGVGQCAGSGIVGDTHRFVYTAVVDLAACTYKCNSDVQCTGFAYAETSQLCEVVSPRAPPGADPARTAIPGTDPVAGLIAQTSTDYPDMHCYEKGDPQTIYDVTGEADTLAQALFVTAIFFIVAAVFACGNIFTIALNKKGKKGPLALASKVCCPCLRDRDTGDEGHKMLGREDASEYSDS